MESRARQFQSVRLLLVAACLVLPQTRASLAADVSETSSCPGWRFSGGTLVLDRSTPDSIVLMQDTTDPTRDMNADDFNFDWRTGWEAGVARDFGCGHQVETRFLSIDSWNAPAFAATNSTLANPLQINSSPVTTAPNVQTVNARYGSELQSLEFNYRYTSASWLTALAGFRYIELHEHLHADMDATPQFFTYDINTQNRMYGFQAGLEGTMWSHNRWSLDSTVKAGLFHNSSRHQSVLDTTFVQTADDSADRLGFVGELGLNIGYQLTDAIAIRGGYDLLWLETVTLASDQTPATDFFVQNGIASDGGVLYHGATFRLEATY